MTTLVLKDLNNLQMVAVADAMLRSGDSLSAANVYRGILAKLGATAPPSLHARVGLAQTPNSRTGRHLAVLEAIQQVDKGSAYVGDGLATWLKSTPFVEDDRFMATADKHASLLPLANWHWNLQTVLWAVQQTRQVPGDLVELGVFRGHTTLFVADYLQFQTWPQTWFLYDTFDGIPEDQLDAGWSQNNKDAYRGTFSVEEVRARFAPYPNIKVIKGRVPEILADGAPDRISFLHMDLNNATAEVAALDVLFDRISPGGMIVFDDYCWAVSHAQRRAEDAWMASRDYRILPLPTGQGLFVKR